MLSDIWVTFVRAFFSESFQKSQKSVHPDFDVVFKPE